MRAWPPFQLLFALVLVAGSAVALYAVLGGRDSPALSVERSPENPKTSQNRSFSLQIESTVPIHLPIVKIGEELLEGAAINERAAVYRGSFDAEEALRIQGEVSAEDLPFALLIEMEIVGGPRRETLRWIDVSPFQIILYGWTEGENR